MSRGSLRLSNVFIQRSLHPSSWSIRSTQGNLQRANRLAAVSIYDDRGSGDVALAWGLMLAAFAAIVCWLTAANSAQGDVGQPAAVVTQVPIANAGQPQRPGGPLRPVAAERGRIVMVTADGSIHLLTAGFHSAADPEISFDGTRMLFAAKRAAEDLWNIFELDLESLAVRQITRNAGNCRQPGYQATLYTIVSTEPWYQLTFTSDMAGQVNEDGSGVAYSLYSCKLDGSSIRRLTYNLSDDADPFVMLDGRLVYAGWQRGTFERGTKGRVALFGVNIDGTDHALFGDLRGLAIKRMPCVTERGLVVFIESEFGGDGSGQLSSVSFRRPLRSYRPITSADDGYSYTSPRPWPGGKVVVARKPTGSKRSFGVYIFDPRSRAATALLDTSEYHELQAVAVSSRPEPDGRSSVVNDEDRYGKLYCLNVNIDDFTDRSWHPPGTAKRIRFLEGVPVSASQTDCYLPPLADSPRYPGSTRFSLAPTARRRILGEIDIRADGSFNVELPANIPVQLQTIDERGVALRTCGWIWSRNREPRGCIGCHEDGELTPENNLMDAMRSESISLTLPPERRRVVDFRHNIMPIVEQKCVVCHGADGAPPRLDGGLELVAAADGRADFNRAYRNLLAKSSDTDAGSYAGKYVNPGQARTSRVIWHLFGQNLSRPWDGVVAEETPTPIPSDGPPAPPLSDRERQAFVQWIDLGAMWDGTAGQRQQQ